MKLKWVKENQVMWSLTVGSFRLVVWRDVLWWSSIWWNGRPMNRLSDASSKQAKDTAITQLKKLFKAVEESSGALR